MRTPQDLAWMDAPEFRVKAPYSVRRRRFMRVFITLCGIATVCGGLAAAAWGQ